MHIGRGHSGDRCPPLDGVDGADLDYIKLGANSTITREDAVNSPMFKTAFDTGTCPLDYPACVLDSSSQNYYCMVRCEESAVACFGQCINPDTNKDYCGADSTCSGYQVCKANENCAVKTINGVRVERPVPKVYHVPKRDVVNAQMVQFNVLMWKV